MCKTGFYCELWKINTIVDNLALLWYNYTMKDKLTVIDAPKRSETKQEFIDDALALANDESCGDIVGYAIVAIYEDGYNPRVEIPEEMDDHFFSLYIHEMVKEGIDEMYEDEEEASYEW